LSQVLNNNLVPDCVRSYLRASKIQNFSGGGEGMPPDPPSRHTRLHMRERAFACYYHYATILYSPTPNSKPCMKPWNGLKLNPCSLPQSEPGLAVQFPYSLLLKMVAHIRKFTKIAKTACQWHHVHILYYSGTPQ